MLLDMKSMLNENTVEEMKDQSTANDLIKLLAVNELFDKEKVKSNSRIKFAQVSQLSKLSLFGSYFNIPFVNDLTQNILELQISINGLGRKELVELVGSVSDPLADPTMKRVRKEIFK